MSEETSNFDIDFKQYFNYDIPYSERKKYQKQFKVTQKQLLTDYPDVFNKVNVGKSKRIEYIDEEQAKEILKEYYIPELIKQNKLRIHTIKSNRTLASGEVKEYDVKLFYKPHDRPSKFGVLLEDEFIEKVINDPNIELVTKVSEIHHYIHLHKDMFDSQFDSFSVINNWVRRYWREKNSY